MSRLCDLRCCGGKKKHNMSLAMVEGGRRVWLLGVEAGSGLQSRLAAMGLIPGVAIDVVSNTGNGPLVIMVINSRVVLGHSMACKIIVR